MKTFNRIAALMLVLMLGISNISGFVFAAEPSLNTDGVVESSSLELETPVSETTSTPEVPVTDTPEQNTSNSDSSSSSVPTTPAESSPVIESNSSASGEPASSEPPVSSDVTSGSSSSEPTEEDTSSQPTEEPGFVELQIEEASTTLTANVGDTVDFFVKLNREDIPVTYQWQRLYTGGNSTPLGEAMYDYADDESFDYAFTLDGMTEAELLAVNPNATWPGMEIYFAELEKAGGDASQVHIENGTKNYILDPEANTAYNEENDSEGSVGTWEDIDGETAATYSHVVDEEDVSSFYRCVVTITDEAYLAERLAALAEDEDAENASSEAALADEAFSGFMTDGMHIEFPTEVEEPGIIEKLANSVSGAALAFGAMIGANNSTAPRLSSDRQWVINLNANYEYITKDAYDRLGASAANDANWTKLDGWNAAGVYNRADGSRYDGTVLVEDNKLEVLSAWYGKTVYFRQTGAMGTGTAIDIPAYTDGSGHLYKKAVRVFNAWVADTGLSFYSTFLSLVGNDGYYDDDTHIEVDKTVIDAFNRAPDGYLKDAEGNYRYDLVVVGSSILEEPDISGAAAWALQEYINEGYGFMIGHDMLYGYAGTNPNPNYVPDRTSTSTPYYVLNSKTNGHWNMNWLMGSNTMYTNTSPYSAASMILCIGDYTDKSTLYGDNDGESIIRITSTVDGDPYSDPTVRVPTNYPFNTHADGAAFNVGSQLRGSATHTNQQMAFGTIWADYASNTLTSKGLGRLVTATRSGLTGTNNYYLTTNGNFGMSQIGHIAGNLRVAKIDECRLLVNTVMYLSQRKQCQVCQSQQGGNETVHFVHKISSAEQLEMIKDQEKYWFTYPADGCYMLVEDIKLPDNWTPIEGFYGHFDADGHNVTLGANGEPLFANTQGTLGEYSNYKSSAVRGWNLGTDKTQGLNSVTDNKGNRSTGVARVVGYLSSLFETGANADWAGKVVSVIGSDGNTYSCVTNSDGKYVISNVPCTGVMVSHVYNTNKIENASAANEITQYGPIRVNVPDTFWDTDETTPLYLLGLTPIPVENREVYQGDDAVFIEGGVYNTTEVTDIQWQVKSTGSNVWQNIEESGLTYQIGTPQFIDAGDDSRTMVSLTINSAKLAWSGYHFRAVFTVAGKTVTTDDRSTASKEGLLTVNPMPAYVEQAFDVEAWAGDDVTYTSSIEYWKGEADGLVVRWQYQTYFGNSWYDISSTNLMTYETTNEETQGQTDVVHAGKKTTTTLTVNAVKRTWSQYHFRVLYEYTDENGTATFVSSDYNEEPNRHGLLVVRQPELSVTDPEEQTVHIGLNDAVSTETATFTSTIEYTPSTEVPTVRWNYNTLTSFSPKAWTQSVATSLYPSSGIAVTIENSQPVPVEGKENTMQIVSTMTITNIPAAMDLNQVKYRFACVAYTDIYGSNKMSSFAPLNVQYEIDIKHNASSGVKNSNGSSTFTYPELDVVAPEGDLLRTLIVQFSSANVDSRDAIAYSNLPSGMTVKGNQYAYTFMHSAGLTAQQWEDWLRANTTYTVYETAVDVLWYIDESLLNGNTYYNSTNGHWYELLSYSGNVDFPTAKARAHSMTFLGMQGYLATITSAAENAAVFRVMTASGVGMVALGASNNPGYGTASWHHWTWLDGPENGVQFTYQPVFTEYNDGGRNLAWPLNGMYTNWTGWEPYFGAGGGPYTSVIRFDGAGHWGLGGSTYQHWAVEYSGLPNLSALRTNHSAYDLDTIGAGYVAVNTDAAITANDSIYDGRTHGATFTVSGAGLSASDLQSIRAGAVITYTYPDGTMSQTAPTHVGTYIAVLTFPGVSSSQYILPAETKCTYNITQRGLNLYSHGNNKVYDGTVAGIIQNIAIEAATATTGVVAGDTVGVSVTTVIGNYKSVNQTAGAEIVMERAGVLSLINNPYSDYFISGENYSGLISPRPLTLHSLYLEDPTVARNVRQYDDTFVASISNVIIDNIVAGDAVALDKDTFNGLYGNKEATEPLQADGNAYPDRMFRLKETTITRTEDISLVNNEAGNYAIGTENYSGGVLRRAISAFVSDMSCIYGDGFTGTPVTAPLYNATTGGIGSQLLISALVGDDELVLDKALSDFDIPEITTTTPVGYYTMAYEGLNETNYPVLANYIMWQADGHISVEPRVLRIAVDGGYEKYYGQRNPDLTATMSYKATQPDENGEDVYVETDGNTLYTNGDTVEESLRGTLQFGTDCVWDSPVQWANDDNLRDDKEIVPYIVTVGGYTPRTNRNGLQNYEIEWVNGDILVLPLKVYLEIDDQEKVYGTQDPELTFTYELDPEVSVEKNVDQPDIELGREMGENVGDYPIEPTRETIGENSNYELIWEPGTLVITPAELIVKADDKTKVYGNENPEFTNTITGLVNGTFNGIEIHDTEDVLSGEVVYECLEGDGETPVGRTTNVGEYDIDIQGSTLAADNYIIVYENGILNITKRPIDVTPGEVIRDMTIEKTADKEIISVGERVTYTLTVTNTGNVDLTSIPIVDTTDAVGVIEAEDGQGYTYNGDGTFTVLRLPVGKTLTLTYSYVALAADAGNNITNVAVATIPPIESDDPEKPGDPGKEVPSEEVVVPVDPDITPVKDVLVTKTADKKSARVGETITYTVTVKNVGNVDLENVSVADTMTGAVGAITPVASDRYVFEDGRFIIAHVSVGETVEILYTYQVQLEDRGNTIVNVAVASIPPDPDDPDDPGKTVPTDPVEVPILKGPDLTISKTADRAFAKVGDMINYTLTITNTGDVDLENVPIQDTHTGGIGIITANSGNGYTYLGAGLFSLTKLHVGETIRVVYSYHVLEADAGNDIVNVAVATVPEHTGNPDDPTDPTIPAKDVTSEEIIVPVDPYPDQPTPTPVIRDLTIVKSADKTQVNVGDTITYTLLVTNTGNVELTDIPVADTHNGTGSIEAENGMGYTYDGNSSFTIARLPAGKSVRITYTYTAQVADGGNTVHNVAVATVPAFPGDPDDPDNNPETPEKPVESNPVDVPVVPLPDPAKGHIKVRKTADTAYARVGEVITYTIKVTNDGQIPLTNVVVTDDSSGHGTINAANGTRYNYLGDGKFIIPNLAINETVEIRYTYTAVEEDNNTSVRNVATGKIPSDPADPDGPGEETPSEEVVVEVSSDPIEIIADPIYKVYGEEDPELTYNISEPLVKPDDLFGDIERIPGENVGEYPIVQGTLDSNNYEIIFHEGIFIITPAPLVIRANDASRPYHSDNPGFSVSALGFKLGDTLASLNGRLSIVTSAGYDSPVGQYPIIPSGLTSKNYEIVYYNGVLTVYDAPVVPDPTPPATGILEILKPGNGSRYVYRDGKYVLANPHTGVDFWQANAWLIPVLMIVLVVLAVALVVLLRKPKDKKRDSNQR